MAAQSLHPSHTPLSEKDNWRTPPWLVDRVEAFLGVRFTLDACASPANALRPLFIAEDHWWRVCRYTDALETDWSELAQTAWMNPPFTPGLREDMLGRAAEMARRGMVIAGPIPYSPDTEWFQELERSVDTLLLPNKRINYLHPSGNPVKGVNFYSAIAVWTPIGHVLDVRRVRLNI